MGFEQFLSSIGKRKIYSFLLGAIYVLLSYGTAQMFFPNSVSFSMVFFITLLLIPSTAKLVTIGEKMERKRGLYHFFRNHAVLMDIFLCLFIGIFFSYIFMGSYVPDSVSYQNSILEKQGLVGNFIKIPTQKVPQLFSIIFNNISIVVIAFILSLFYGIGALFLIVLNASVFATFILKATQLITQQKVLSTAILSIHIIPEVFGFLLAALAGGVISKGFFKEKVGTNTFQNVIKDGTVLLILSILVIIIAALIEVFVTPVLIKPLL